MRRATKAPILPRSNGSLLTLHGQRVEIIAFPECCISGYWHLRKLSRDALIELAEPLPDGPAARRLLSLSREHEMTIGAGLVELDGDGKLYNSFFVAMPDGRWACHRKLHVFVSDYLTPGIDTRSSTRRTVAASAC